jgi:hypothetical protein
VEAGRPRHGFAQNQARGLSDLRYWIYDLRERR